MFSFRVLRLGHLSVVTLCLLICFVPAFCFQSAAPASDDGYPVTIEGHILLHIHEGLGTFNAEERAQRGTELLRRLAFSGQDVSKISTVDEPWGTEVVLGGDVLMVVTDGEAKYTGLPRQLVARQYATRTRDLVNQVRLEHSKQYLWAAVLKAAITLVVYGLIIWLVIWGIGKVLRKLETYSVGHLKGITIQQSEILAGARIARLLATALQLLRVVVVFSLAYLLLAAEFSYFPYTREHSQALLAYMTAPLGYVSHGLISYLPNVAFIAVIAIVMTFVLRFVRFLAAEVERGNIRLRGFYPEWVQPTYKIIRLLLYAFAVVLVFPYLPGSQSPAFKGVTLFLGVLFSLGSTSVVSNVVAGTLLIYTRGFRMGDWVKIGDNMGEVLSQSLLATHLRTVKNEEITIPSSVVLSSYITNYSRMAAAEGLILHTSVTIGYDAPWRTIHQLLIDAAKKTKYIKSAPQPFVLQNALDDSYVEYMINAYTDRPIEMVNIYSELHANIQDCFYAAGVEIMSPVYSALRDGNRTAIPSEYLPADYRPKGFRIQKDDDATAAASGKS